MSWWEAEAGCLECQAPANDTGAFQFQPRDNRKSGLGILAHFSKASRDLLPRRQGCLPHLCKFLNEHNEMGVACPDPPMDFFRTRISAGQTPPNRAASKDEGRKRRAGLTAFLFSVVPRQPASLQPSPLP